MDECVRAWLKFWGAAIVERRCAACELYAAAVTSRYSRDNVGPIDHERTKRSGDMSDDRTGGKVQLCNQMACRRTRGLFHLMEAESPEQDVTKKKMGNVGEST